MKYPDTFINLDKYIRPLQIKQPTHLLTWMDIAPRVLDILSDNQRLTISEIADKLGQMPILKTLAACEHLRERGLLCVSIISSRNKVLEYRMLVAADFDRHGRFIQTRGKE